MVSKNMLSAPYAINSLTCELYEPTMTVGIIDRQVEVHFCLNGNFYGYGLGPFSGRFSARVISGNIVLFDEYNREVACTSVVRLTADTDSTFTLSQVTIGKQFHWERKENQIFQGSLILKARKDETIAVINEIPLEDYLKSVVSSEMSGNAPMEFLKAHAIISRSWLMAALDRKRKMKESFAAGSKTADNPDQAPVIAGEVIRWYEQEDHDLYDVCADDHCQRYQGVTKIVSANAGEAVLETRGQAITYQGKVCDARYSKACGGITERFETSWSDNQVPYLTSISDAAAPCLPVLTEEDAAHWILSEPDAYCNTKDVGILANILPDFDRETRDFFRWKIEYTREELEKILLEKSGIDFGTLKEIQPLTRGPSGRISRLKIAGSKESIIVGKELEIRRWLSGSHLYSSAFIVKMEYNDHGEAKTVVFYGAGWGHGVGLCQIGAAVMATQGFSTEEILRHYFPDAEIQRMY